MINALIQIGNLLPFLLRKSGILLGIEGEAGHYMFSLFYIHLQVFLRCICRILQ